MFKHILVPIDGSKRSEQALPYALEIAPEGATVTLFHVVEMSLTPFPISPAPPVLTAETESYEIYHQKQIETARAYLEKTVAALPEHAASIRTELIAGGNPAEHILAFAEEEAVDVIVMATRGHSGVTRWLMGSVTQKILQATTYPVLVVPER